MCYLHDCHPGPMFPEDETQAARERVAAKRAERRRAMSKFDGYKIRASANKMTLNAEVGPEDTVKGGLEFGMTATVYRRQSWSSDQRVDEGSLVAEVSQSSIGSTDPETARRRIASYEAAVSIAEFLNNANEILDNVSAAALLDGKTVDEVFKAFMLREDPERFRVRA